MAHDYLLCPRCKCPLSPPARQSTGMPCPRCNEWVEIDPACTGACLSCHKTLGKQGLTSCTDPAAVPVSISSARAATGDESNSTARDDSEAPGGWKRLWKGIFTVR